MANCHNLFEEYTEKISLTKGKKDRMIKSRDGLRDRIRKCFREKHPGYVPKFYIQGSNKMKTGIRTKDDICDLDDGIYFFRTPDVTATTLQEWVRDAVDGYTDTAPEHRKKCIRNIFLGDYEIDMPIYYKYEIDMPIYYKVDGKEYQLAVKNVGWEDSDPKAMVDWFNERKDKEGRLIKVVKYLKAWCDHKRNKMPNGLVMTILATNAKERIVYNERDDITLKDILKEIKKALDSKFECIVPAVPNDDLFADYDEQRKNNFLNALNSFIEDAEKALKETNQLEASRLWKIHLGNRFPEGENKDEDQEVFASIIVGAKTSNPWGTF